ncbi:MAG TPA: hypothetical protein VGG39_23275 [Polyangiaceae bacterium]
MGTNTGVRLALGIAVRTGWAACLVAGGSLRDPRVVVREHVELLGDPERFVFHRASEGTPADAPRAVASARAAATEISGRVLRRLKAEHGVVRCAVVAKGGAMPELTAILASHPRIHTAEGMFYRDVILGAAEACWMEAQLVLPSSLDLTSKAVTAAGKAVGRPWSAEWKAAALAAWSLLG